MHQFSTGAMRSGISLARKCAKLFKFSPLAFSKHAAIMLAIGTTLTPAQVYAGTHSLQFVGNIIRNDISGFQLATQNIVAFGNEAGVVLRSTNGGKETTRLAHAVFDGSHNRVSSQMVGGVDSVAPNTTAERMLIIPLNGKGKQQFKVCAKLVGYSAGTVSKECFNVQVNSL